MRSAVARGFAIDGPFGTQWAYAIDARGGQRHYHDANDLPVALAPLLGFVARDDTAWQATMRFAFSAHNPAFVPGQGGGLGSLHTPGVWPLGDVQEWVWASIAGDDRRVDRVLSRLAAVQRHGMLPEAYDPANRRLAVTAMVRLARRSDRSHRRRRLRLSHDHFRVVARLSIAGTGWSSHSAALSRSSWPRW